MVNFPTYFFAMGEDMNVVVVLNVGKQDEGGWVFFFYFWVFLPWREDLMKVLEHRSSKRSLTVTLKGSKTTSDHKA